MVGSTRPSMRSLTAAQTSSLISRRQAWDQDIGRELKRSGNSREKISTLPLAQSMTTWEVRGPPSRPTRRIDQTPIMTFAQTAHFCPTHTAIAFNPAEADVTT